MPSETKTAGDSEHVRYIQNKTDERTNYNKSH